MGFPGRGRFHHPGEPEEEYQRKVPDRVLISRLLKYILTYRKPLALVLVSVLVTSVVGAVGPYILGREVIAKYIQQGDIHGLQLMALVLLGILLASWVFEALQSYEIGWIGQNMLFKMRSQLFSHLQELSFSFFDRMDNGDLVSRVTNDTDSIGETFTSEAVSAISGLLSLVFVIIFMLIINVNLTLVSLAVTPLMVFAALIFQPRFRSAYRLTRVKISKVTSRLEESISGIKEIQSFVREKDVMEEFRQANVENLKANVQATKVWGSFFPTIQFIEAIGSAIVMLYGGMLVLNGELGHGNLDAIGTLISFLIYVQMFFGPILNLTNLYNTIQSAFAAAERIFELMDAPPDVMDKPDAVELPPIKGEIQFENIIFGYDPKHSVLQNISFHVKPMETIALVGPTGAGKSTIIKLLSRFYEPQSGTIKVDNYDLRQVKQDSLHRQMGIVLQETFLFNGTIIENIRYGKLEATEEEVVNAAKLVGAHEFIEHLPEGYNTKVSEGGSNLSLGQRQLVSFARALLRDPPILILDEATSSVDPYTELLIKKALQVLLKDRTSIVIAHRLSTVRNADRIMVIDEGRIVEEGNHDELMKKGGLYRHLYEMQFKEPVGMNEGLKLDQRMQKSLSENPPPSNHKDSKTT